MTGTPETAARWLEQFASLWAENGYTGSPCGIYAPFLSLVDRRGKVLELGCGNGLLLRFLCEHSPHHLEPYGVECDASLVEHARTRIFPGRPQTFRCGDAAGFDFPDAPYNVIITNPLYADDGYRRQEDGRIAALRLDGSVRRYVRNCWGRVASKGRLLLFCYNSQLEEIGGQRADFERALGVVPFRIVSPAGASTTFYVADKGPGPADFAADLVAMRLGDGEEVRVNSGGSSMGLPEAEARPLVIRPLKRRPRFGDVLLFRRADGLVVHRVIGCLRGRAGRWLVKGDTCLAPDPPVTRAEALGLAVAVETPSGRWTPWSWRPPWAQLRALVSRLHVACRSRRPLARLGDRLHAWACRRLGP